MKTPEETADLIMTAILDRLEGNGTDGSEPLSKVIADLIRKTESDNAAFDRARAAEIERKKCARLVESWTVSDQRWFRRSIAPTDLILQLAAAIRQRGTETPE